MPHDTWSEQRLQKLMQLIKQGKTAGQISRLMHLSRSSICGKAMRLGLHINGCKVQKVSNVYRYYDMRPTVPFVQCLAGKNFPTFVMREARHDI